MRVVRLAPEAVDELAEAAEWYRTQRPGLEMEFLTEIGRVLPLIEYAAIKAEIVVGTLNDRLEDLAGFRAAALTWM